MDNSTGLLNLIFHTGLILTPFYLLYALNKYNIKILNKYDLEFDDDSDHDSDDTMAEECSVSSADSGLDSDDENESDEETSSSNSNLTSDVLVSDISVSDKLNIDMVPLIKNTSSQTYYLSNDKNDQDDFSDDNNTKIHNKIKTILDELSEL